ncbi:ankyrin repeat-containing domain protein [Trichoderma compactum]
MALALAPIKQHSPLALDNRWQYIALGIIKSNNNVALLKANQCKMFHNEKILKLAFKISSDKSSCVLAKSYPNFVQKHSAKLLSDAIRLGNSSFITIIVSQGDTIREDYVIPEAGVTILSMAEFVAPNPHPILWQKYLRHMRHIGEAHKQGKRSPLHLAAISGHRLFIEQAITWMKDHDVDPAEALNDRDQFGATALFLASQHGHFDIVRQLIAAGANLAICDKRKQSPLHIACKMGNSEIVAKLVAAGANPDGQDQLKKTPLHLALENRHTAAAANLLLDCTLATLKYQRPGGCGKNCQHVGSDAITGEILSEMSSEKLMSHFVTLSTGTSVVGTAKSREVTIALPFMTTRILVSKSSDADGATPLIIATKNNMVEIVKTLLRYDVDVYNKDQPHGHDAIQYATDYGQTEILELFLAAMPSQKDIYSDWQISSPLHLASLSIAVKSYQTNAVASIASHCSLTNRNTTFLEASKLNLLNIVEVLINARADIDSVDGSGSSALHYCASRNNARLMQLLISKGCDLNTVDHSHRTPAFVAVEAGNLKSLKMLIDAGANVNIHDSAGFTPLRVAAYRANDRAVQLLLMANCTLSLTHPSTDTGLLEKSLKDYSASVFRHIVSKLAASRKLQLQPDTLLWFLQGGHCDIEKLRSLLENGVDPNLIIGEYGSMLHYAALWGRVELVGLLCKFNRVDINMIHPNKTHGTPLQLSAFRGNSNGPKVIEILLARDANIYKGSGFYGSALNVAAAMPCLKDAEDKRKMEAAYIHMAQLLVYHEKTIINFSAGPYSPVLLGLVALFFIMLPPPLDLKLFRPSYRRKNSISWVFSLYISLQELEAARE